MSCRPCEGGTPKCLLGTLGARTIEVRGNSWENILRVKNGKPPLPIQYGPGIYDVVFVADSPGFDDDWAGMPGIGGLGDQLMEFLNKSGLDLSKVYLTHTVRCRPPKNRKPSVTELNVCKEYINVELLDLRPKVVVLLGNTALRVFNLQGKGGIQNIHGTVWNVPLPKEPDSPIFTVIPTFNPATLFHNPSPELRRIIASDYTRIAQVVSGQNLDSAVDTYVCNYKVIKTDEDFDWLVQKLSSVEVFSFDTESCGLPWSKQKMLCSSFCWGYDKDDPEPKVALLPFFKHNPAVDPPSDKFWPSNHNYQKLMDLKHIFENPNISKIAHNIKYDYNVLRFWAGIEIKGYLWDTMLMHHLLHEQPPHDLEHLADIEFRTGDYSKSKRDIVGQGKVLNKTYDHIPDEILWPYAANDAECAFRLFELYSVKLQNKPNLFKLYDEEVHPALTTFAECEWNGNRILMDKVDELKDYYEKEQINLLRDLKKIAGPAFNPASNVQVKNTIIKLGFGAAIEDKRAASGYNTNKIKLSEIRNECPVAGWILDYRTNAKMISTYLENVKLDIDLDGRVRHSFLQHGTTSGRLACRFLHQIPRKKKDKNLRDIFGVDTGYKYVYMDYSQIELRVMAIYAKDEVMLRLYREGKDIHTATASQALGIPEDQISDFNRQLGKAINFGLIFMSEGYQLVDRHEYEDSFGKLRPLTLTMVQKFLTRTRKLYSGITKFCEDIPMQALVNGGTLATVFGRERRLGNLLNAADEGLRKHAEREAVNFIVQSTAGAITVRTASKMAQIIRGLVGEGKLKPGDIRLINTVHDSIAYEVKEHLVPWFLGVLKSVAERPIPELDNACFPANFGVGNTWSEAEEASK